MCRTQLQEEHEDDASDADDDDDDDDDSNYSSDSDQDDTRLQASAELLTERLLASGITMVDVIAMYIGRIDVRNPRYSDGKIEKMINDFDNVIDMTDRDVRIQHDEQMGFMDEDLRRHHRKPPPGFLETTNEIDVLCDLFH